MIALCYWYIDMDVGRFAAIIVCSICAFLNIIAIITLSMSKKTKKCVFKRLVLCLSISNLELVFGISFHLMVFLIDNGQPYLTYICLVLKHLISGAFMFSLFQCLLVCFERLNATFTTRKKYLHNLSSNKAIGLGFVFINIAVVIDLGFDIWRGLQYRCYVPDALNVGYVVVEDVPTALMCSLTIFIYGPYH